MKKISKRTWICIGCVVAAIVASRMYTGLVQAPEKEVVTDTTVKVAVTPAASATPKAVPVETLAKPSPAPAKEVPASAPVLAAQSSPAASPKALEFQLPSTGEVSRPYSASALTHFAPLSEWRCHLGMDFLPSENDIVYSTADGTVAAVYDDHLYGKCVKVHHGDELYSIYGSLSEVTVTEGTFVKIGTQIGHMGDTAPAEEGVHLHFSMEKNGKPIDPLGEK